MTVLSWCQKMEEMLVQTRLKYEMCLVWGTITTTPSFSSGNRMELCPFYIHIKTANFSSPTQNNQIFKVLNKSESLCPSSHTFYARCHFWLNHQSLKIQKLQQSHWNILSHALWTSKANTSRPQWTPSRGTLCG